MPLLILSCFSQLCSGTPVLDIHHNLPLVRRRGSQVEPTDVYRSSRVPVTIANGSPTPTNFEVRRWMQEVAILAGMGNWHRFWHVNEDFSKMQREHNRFLIFDSREVGTSLRQGAARI